MPSHVWTLTFSFAPAYCFSKAAVMSLVQPGGLEPLITQTVSVLPLKSPGPAAWSLCLPSDDPHAATDTASTAAPSTAIAALPLTITSPSDEVPETPLVSNGLDQYPELGLDL